MVTVNELVKTYGQQKDIVAVDHVSFSVEKAEIFGLIGPDGAGKTSLFRMLTTLLLPDSGSASVNGFDIVKDYKKIRSSVGYMPGKFSLYQDLSVEENLNFFATVFGTTLQENYDLIKDIYVQLEPFKKRRAGKLSGGMKQKLALCCALIHKPDVLFLDEPTTGVDPVSRREFWEMLKRLKMQNITILVSTAYMDEASMCDRIALMHNGKILSIDTPAGISASYSDQLFAVKAENMSKLLKALSGCKQILSCYSFGQYAHVSVKRSEQNIDEILNKCLENTSYEKLQINPIQATVEDCFIKLLN